MAHLCVRHERRVREETGLFSYRALVGKIRPAVYVDINKQNLLVSG